VKDTTERPIPKKPAKCPCERGTALVDSIPADNSTTQDLGGILRLANEVPVDFLNTQFMHGKPSDSSNGSLGYSQNEFAVFERFTTFCVLRC